MELYIKQRVFSWGQKFDICDAKGNRVYYCQGEVFTLGRKLHIYDNTGNEVVFIKQRIFRFMPQYEIYINGRLEATLIKQFTFFKHNYYYDGVDWFIEGDFFAHDYRITSNGQIVMTISKQWLTWGDTYDLSINDKFNHLLALASCIVVDCVCHESNHTN